MQMGFLTVLSLIFIVLKLCGVIAWSWVWALAPFWISLIIALLGLITILYIKSK